MGCYPLMLWGKAIQSALEQQFITQYLRDKDVDYEDLGSMPVDKARELMAEASLYASLRLAEIESRSKFIQKIA